MKKQTRSDAQWLITLLIGLMISAQSVAEEPVSQSPTNYKKSLTVASSNSFPPINMLDSKGNLIGFGRDISDAVLNTLGIEIKRQHSSIWPNVLAWLDKGEVDFIHDTGYTKSRDAYLDYTSPIIEMPEMIFVNNERLDINTLESLNGKTVACVNKHITHLYLQQFPGIKCHIVHKPVEGLYALLGGTVDAFIYPREIVMYFAQQLRVSNKIKMVGEPLRVLSWSMTVKEGNTELVSILNEGIKQIRENGQYEKIYNKWFGKRLLAGYTEAEVKVIIISAIIISLFFGTSIVLLIYNRRLEHSKTALEQSERKYTEVASNVPGAVFRLTKYKNEDCQIEFISNGFGKIIGEPVNSLLGNLKNLVSHIHPDDQDRFKESLLHSISNKSLWQSEFRVISNNGELAWFRISSLPDPTDKDRMIYNGILLNITDIKELQQRQDKFFELTNNMLCIAGFDGYFKLLNPSWQKTLGYSLDELSAKPFIEFVHPEDQAKTILEAQKLSERKNETVGFENRYQCKDGRYRHLHWMAITSPYTDEIYAAAHDITELKGAKEKLQQAYDELEERVKQRTNELEVSNESLQKEIEQRRIVEQAMQEAKNEAERSNQAKSDFLSRMSHELRTPLNAILGFSQLLETDSELKGTEYAVFAHEIFQAGEHLLDLINEVLDLSRIEAGKLDINIANIDLNNLLNECLTFIKPLANTRDIKVINKLGNNKFIAHADGMRLKQVLLNLLSNAVKYNSHGGTITVDCLSVNNDMIKCSITDTGQGLSTDDQANLFQAFNRLGAEHSEIEGTGIGLVITRKLIELMQGELSVESQQGQGSCFSFTLRQASNDKNTETATINSSTENYPSLVRSHMVLYVEDNQTNVRLVKSALKKFPQLKLVTAVTAEEGLDIIAADRPDIILMDINLPGMNGLEALAHLQKDPATKHIPVIAITADAMPKAIEEGLQAGFKAYLTKPFNIDKLHELIQKYLTGSAVKAVNQ